MSQLLALHRAARIVGVPRGVLQQKIKEGELRASDGMISTDDLLAAYPDTKFEEDLIVEHLERLKDEAFSKRVREHVLPSRDVLAARLYAQSRELADLRNHLQHYHAIVINMHERLRKLKNGQSHASELAALDRWLDLQLEEVLNTEAPDPLDVLDNYLRVVSAQVVLRPSGHQYFVEGSDTILEAGLRAGLAMNYGCSNGNCGLCKARVVAGQVTKVRHHDYVLSETEKNMGYTLMCSYAPINDLTIEALEAAGPADIPRQEIQTRVKSVQNLGSKLKLLHLQTPRTNRLRFLAGQRVALSVGEEGASEHAVASCPCDDRNLQFHIHGDSEQAFERRVFAGMKPGDSVTLRGPFGSFVLREDANRPLLLLACDSGFAPIKSLIEHAMALDHADTMHLYWLASTADGHYQANLCRSWTDALDNFEYSELSVGSLDEHAITSALAHISPPHFSLRECVAYIAGPQQFIGAAHIYVLEHGVDNANVLTEIVS